MLLPILVLVLLIVSVVLAVMAKAFTAEIFALWAIALALCAPLLKAIT